MAANYFAAHCGYFCIAISITGSNSGGLGGDMWNPAGLAFDSGGNLYVADFGGGSDRIQKRDAQGNWSVLATSGTGLGQVISPGALTVDAAGDLYVADAWRRFARPRKVFHFYDPAIALWPVA